MESPKRLYRSKTERMVGGVCGGLAEYLKMDVTLVRLFFLLLLLIPGPGAIIYIIMWVITPVEP